MKIKSKYGRLTLISNIKITSQFSSKKITQYSIYKIKKTVNDVNSGFKKIGKGVNEGVLWDVDVKF